MRSSESGKPMPRLRAGSARFNLVKADSGNEFEPASLVNEALRSQAWGLRELARVSLDLARETVVCPHCGEEVEVPGTDVKGRIEALKTLLDGGLKLLKQSGDEEAVADLQAAIGKAAGDAGQRGKSVRDLQREAAAKLGVSSQ